MKTCFRFVLLFAFILSACGLPKKQASGPALPPVEALPTGGEAPVVLVEAEPPLGTTGRWFDGSTLVYVPKGEFKMGHGEEDNPEHTVFLDGFWIYRTEVTNGMYTLCIYAGACTPPVLQPGRPSYTSPKVKDQPITNVNWAQGDAYCKWMGGRLPSEAEWEKTARGPDGKLYPWGDAAPDCTRLNYNNCVGGLSSVLDHPDGQSYVKALDLEGNASEWVADWYLATYYDESPTENPLGPETGTARSIRGANFLSTEMDISSARRFSGQPELYRPDLGFRCVIFDPNGFAPACTTTSTLENPSSSTSGGEPGASTVPGCDPPKFDETSYCNNTGGTNVDIDLPGGSSIPGGGLDCSDAGGGNTSCSTSITGPLEVEVCWECEPEVVPDQAATCAPGYELDAAQCECVYVAGSQPVDPTFNAGNDCPVGFALNSAANCCDPIVPAGTSPGSEKPICDAGFSPLGCVCAPEDVVPEPACTTLQFEPKSCGLNCTGYGDEANCNANGCTWACVDDCHHDKAGALICKTKCGCNQP